MLRAAAIIAAEVNPNNEFNMKRICVYCGARAGARAEYLRAAEALGEALAARGIGLVYGGGGAGMMGRIADSVLAGGGEVIGVIPRGLFDAEQAHRGLSELKVVDDMHARKALMMDLSDGFIALPGGLGTLEELFEILAWAKLKLHHKPCALLNACGYYDALVSMLAHVVSEGFADAKHCDSLLVEAEASRLVQRMLGER